MSTCVFMFFFFKQKTAYEMRISDWSSDVCSSDLRLRLIQPGYSGTALKRALAGSQTPGYNADMSSTIWMLLAAAGVMAASCAATDRRASCRERVCQYVSISVVAVSLKKKIREQTQKKNHCHKQNSKCLERQ